MPKPDYDSLWAPVAPNSIVTLSHGLVGNPSDFLVDLTFLDPDNLGKHQKGLGGMADTLTGHNFGAYWNEFGTTPDYHIISIRRLPGDTIADSVRVRIWRINAPAIKYSDTYAPGQARTLTDGVHINADNVLVEATASNAGGEHKIFYGRMDVGPDGLWGISPDWQLGFYWYLLSDDSVGARRMQNDPYALGITLRVWSLPTELYLPLIRK